MAPETITLYGIPNCDTVRKARTWLAAQGVEARFHDLRRDGASPEMLLGWAREVGWETLLNRKGTTWRGLPETDRQAVRDMISACRLMAKFPSLVKRPVVQWPQGLTVGFDPDDWATRAPPS